MFDFINLYFKLLTQLNGKLANSETLVVNPIIGDGTVTFVKCNNIVSVTAVLANLSLTNGWNKIVALPDYFADIVNSTDFFVIDNTATSRSESPIQARIENGYLTIYSFATVKIAIHINKLFLTK